MADAQQGDPRGSAAEKYSAYTIERRDRHWAVRDSAGELVCLTVYKRGAEEVIRRLHA